MNRINPIVALVVVLSGLLAFYGAFGVICYELGSKMALRASNGAKIAYYERGYSKGFENGQYDVLGYTSEVLRHEFIAQGCK